MSSRKELGFSLIELLLVVVIIGIVAAMAIPAYQKGMWAAENGSAFSTLRTISSTQVSFYTQKNRFARLDEVNAQLSNAIGTQVGDKLVRGKYVFEMTPPRPDDADLTTEYFITATRDVAGDAMYQYELNHSGRIVQVYPEGSPDN
jgi:prepilin-type N-terminal cleavage/methylation domain-containing protein